MNAVRRLAPLALALLAAHSTLALAAPVPISACTTIGKPGSYQLVRNLFAQGDCIIIQSDFVSLDLDGYMIQGNGTGYGVTNQVIANGITVRNGTITGFVNGVMLSGNTAMLIERLHVIGNSNTGIGASTAIVRDNVVARNPKATGISVGPRSLVTGNVSTENDIGIIANLGSTIIGNTVGVNTMYGIVAYEGSTVVNNTSRNHGSYGIEVECPSLVLGNASTANGINLHMTGANCTTDHNAAP